MGVPFCYFGKYMGILFRDFGEKYGSQIFKRQFEKDSGVNLVIHFQKFSHKYEYRFSEILYEYGY